MKLPLALGLGMFCCAVQAGDPATIVRSTDLKAKPFIDAATLANLPENQAVDVIVREGSWDQVKAKGPAGWVKMLSLRFPELANQSGDSGTSSTFLGSGMGTNRAVSTTGAKGLSKENMQAAQPNPEAVKKTNGFVTNRNDAQQFARQGKLVAQQVKYLGE